jgi:hypothetical protein
LLYAAHFLGDVSCMNLSTSGHLSSLLAGLGRLGPSFPPAAGENGKGRFGAVAGPTTSSKSSAAGAAKPTSLKMLLNDFMYLPP